MIPDEQIEVTVRETIELILGRSITAGEHVARENEADWDSLRHVELLLSLEGALNIRFDEDELRTLNSLEELVVGAKRHLAP